MSNAIVSPRQAPRGSAARSLPFPPAQQQPATLLQPSSSSDSHRRAHGRTVTLARSQGASPRTTLPTSCSAGHNSLSSGGGICRTRDIASTSGRTAPHPAPKPVLWPAHPLAIRHSQPDAAPTRAGAPRPDTASRFPPHQPATRTAAALMLAASVTLSVALGPSAAAITAPAPMPLQQQGSSAPANGAQAAGSGSRVAAAAPAAVSAPPVRFTGPEVLDQLPPLPVEFPMLPELKLPSYTTARLRNGLRVFLLRDDEVPLVRATLLMRGGQYGSPPDKVGLASLTAFVQRAGGSAAHPAASLDSRLEELAASIEVGAGPQAISADMQCLAEDVEEVMGLMAELVRTPLLPADKLALYQAQVLNALDHQNDSPAAIARRKITKLLYGPDSVYARTPTRAGITAISPADLRAYAETWERPDAAVLGVVGAIEPRQMLTLVEREFCDWAPAPGQPEQPLAVPRGAAPAVPALTPSGGAVAEEKPPATNAAATSSAVPSAPRLSSLSAASIPAPASPAAAPPVAAVAPLPPPGSGRRPVVYLVDRPGLTQAVVLTAEPGIALSDPAVYPLDVLGGVFNSFGGQLFDTLRSREGLAYSVSGSWDTPADHQGLFLAGGQTSSPGEFLRALRLLLARAAAEPPSEAELEAAKAETLNSFAFNFASAANQLQRILVYDLIGLPQNFLFSYIKGIEGVTRSDVAAAAAAQLHPERQAVVVVADRDSARPSLEAAGFEVLSMRLED